MFGIGLPEMILILALALIVVGPDKLPELARSVAKGVLELKKIVSALKEDLAEENPFDSVKPELEEAAESIKKQLGEATPDGFTGIVKDLEEGLQEVIDVDGTTLPVTSDETVESKSEAGAPPQESDEISQVEPSSTGSEEATLADPDAVPEDDQKEKSEDLPQPPSPS